MKPSLYDILSEFFDDLDEEYSFTPLEIAIYWRLVHKCNRRKWKNPVPYACDDFRSKVKCKNAESKTAFDTARNRLKQAGLITYIKGNGRGHITHYTLHFPAKESLNGAEKVVQNQPLSPPLSVPLSPPLSKLPKKEEDKEKDYQEGDASLTPKEKNSSGGKNTQKSVKGVKSEKPELAARVKTSKVERNPLWMKYWADFQESYPKSYRTDWKKSEELFAELLHKGGENDDGNVSKRGRWLATQAHFYGELCQHEHREEQYVKAADKWLADEDEFKRDYCAMVKAMPKNGRGSPMPEGMVL